MKNIILLIIIISINPFLRSQENELNTDTLKRTQTAFYIVHSGLNISKFHSTVTGVKPEYFNLYGLSIGYMSEVPTSVPYFYKQFGIEYSELGSAGTKDRKTSIKIKYIRLPLLFNFKFGTPVFKVYAGFGGYIAMAFAGTAKDNGQVTSEDILGWEYGDDVSPKYYQYEDAGILVGGGFQYILPNKDGIQISVHYGYGLVPISNEVKLAGTAAYNPKEYNRNINISVAYMFGKPYSRKK